MLTQGGSLILVQSVLSAIAIFHLLSLDPPPRVFKAIDKITRAFLWKGNDVVEGETAWPTRKPFSILNLLAALTS